MKDGFYKYLANNLIYAINSVHAPNYTLFKEEKNTYQFPIDDWYWFDTLQDACGFYKLDISEYLPKQNSNTSMSNTTLMPPIIVTSNL